MRRGYFLEDARFLESPHFFLAQAQEALQNKFIVLTQLGWGLLVVKGGFGQANRVGHTGHATVLRVRDIDSEAASLDVWVCKNALQGVDRATRHASTLHDEGPVVDAARARDLLEQGGELIAVGDTVFVR